MLITCYDKNFDKVDLIIDNNYFDLDSYTLNARGLAFVNSKGLIYLNNEFHV